VFESGDDSIFAARVVRPTLIIQRSSLYRTLLTYRRTHVSVFLIFISVLSVRYACI